MRQLAGGRPAAGAAGLLLLALAVLVVGATGAGPGAPAAPAEGALAASALTRAGFILLAVASVTLIGLMVWTLWGWRGRPDVGTGGSRRSYMIATLVQAWIVILVLWLRPELQRALIRKLPNQAAGAGALPPLPNTAPNGVVPASVHWLTVAIVVAVLAAAAFYIWRGLRRPRRRSRKVAREAVQAAVDESLADLDGGDLRRAVIRAYARMEAALAEAGLPRRAPETSLEYMARALRWLGAPSEHVSRLTDLFNLARFSHHAVGAEMRTQAVTALDGIRADLAGRPRGRP